MSTMIETKEDRRARIHAGVLASFESGVRYHFANPPETWTVRKAAERCWHLVNAAGDTLMSFPRKRDADTALEMSLSSEMRGQSFAGRNWRERDEWYRGTSNDPRNRALTDEETAIVARVLAEHAPDPSPEYDDENRCTDCGAHIAEPHAPGCPRGDDGERECGQCGDSVAVGLSSRDWCDGCEAEEETAARRVSAVAHYRKWRSIRDHRLLKLSEADAEVTKAADELVALGMLP